METANTTASTMEPIVVSDTPIAMVFKIALNPRWV